MCKLPKQSNLYLVIFIVVAVVVGGFFYFQINKPLDVDFGFGDNVGESTALPEGVVVEEVGGKVYVDNDLDGYELEITVTDSKVSYDSSVLTVVEPTIQDKQAEGGGYTPRYNISVLNYSGDLESWVESWIGEQKYSQQYSYEKIDIDGETAYIINIPSMGNIMKSLVFQKNNKIFSIDTSLLDPVNLYKQLEVK